MVFWTCAVLFFGLIISHMLNCHCIGQLYTIRWLLSDILGVVSETSISRWFYFSLYLGQYAPVKCKKICRKTLQKCEKWRKMLVCFAISLIESSWLRKAWLLNDCFLNPPRINMHVSCACFWLWLRCFSFDRKRVIILSVLGENIWCDAHWKGHHETLPMSIYYSSQHIFTQK